MADKGKGLGILIALGKKPSKGGDGPMGDEGHDEEKDHEDSSAHDIAAEDLAECLEVPEEKRDEFKDALHRYVKACLVSFEKEPHEEYGHEDKDESEGKY